MTTAPAVAVASARARLRVGAAADVVAIGALALLVTALSVVTWRRWGDLDLDTGYDVVAGIRVAAGEVPYADFLYYYGPLAPALAGLAALIGGSGFGPAIALGFVITLLILVATYVVARIFLPPTGAFLATAITVAVAFIPSNFSYVVPHTHAATLGTLFVLLAIIAVWRAAAERKTVWFVLLGVAIGLATLTKPEPAAAIALAVALWIALAMRRKSISGREIAWVAGPALTVPVLVYGAFLSRVSLHRLLFDNLYPTKEMDAGGTTMLRSRMPLTLESLGDLALKTVLYAIGVGAIVLIANRLASPGRGRKVAAAAVVVLAAGAIVVSIVKPDGLRDGLYYVYGWIPVGAAVATVVLMRSKRATPWTAEAQAALVAAASLAVLAATTYSGFVVHGWSPSMPAYYIPLAAVLLARLHVVEFARNRYAYVLGVAWVAFIAAAGVGMTIKDANAESGLVRGPGGVLAETPGDADVYQAAVRWIDRETQPGDPVFVSPLLTSLYVLADRPDPLYQISTLPTALPTSSEQREAIARMERAGVRVAITDRRTWRGFGHTSFGLSFQQLVAAWLHREFRLVTTIRANGEKGPRALDVWIRRSS
jgi:hypothetical protein